MSDIVFLDTETLGLNADAPIWEFAAVRCSPSGERTVAEIFISHHPGRWLDSFPAQFREDYENRFNPDLAFSGFEASQIIDDITRGAHIIGAVPNFDTERLTKLLRRNSIEPAWHYHLIDIENVVVGYLAAGGKLVSPPWKSDQLSAAVGVDPNDFQRHTAMGDVKWTMAQWDAVMGGLS